MYGRILLQTACHPEGCYTSGNPVRSGRNQYIFNFFTRAKKKITKIYKKTKVRAGEGGLKSIANHWKSVGNHGNLARNQKSGP